MDVGLCYIAKTSSAIQPVSKIKTTMSMKNDLMTNNKEFGWHIDGPKDTKK